MYWKIKKQNVVVRSSAQEEYELWQWSHVKSYGSSNFRRVKFEEIKEMKLVCNEIALHIASNLVFDKRTTHIMINCHSFSPETLSQSLCSKIINLPTYSSGTKSIPKQIIYVPNMVHNLRGSIKILLNTLEYM